MNKYCLMKTREQTQNIKQSHSVEAVYHLVLKCLSYSRYEYLK